MNTKAKFIDGIPVAAFKPESLKGAVVLAATTVCGRSYADKFVNVLSRFLEGPFQQAIIAHPEHTTMLKELFLKCTQTQEVKNESGV